MEIHYEHQYEENDCKAELHKEKQVLGIFLVKWFKMAGD